jgi:hypothetical protein
MWRSPYQAPPPLQSLALDVLTLRRAVPTLPLREYVGPPLPAQFYPVWNQPPPLQGVGTILSKLAVVSTLSPPFGATVIGRVEQFSPVWRQPPPQQDPALGFLSNRIAVPTLLFTGQLAQFNGQFYPVWRQPPLVQDPAAAILSKLAVTSPFAGPFGPTLIGRALPDQFYPPWRQPPPPIQDQSLAALSKLAVVASPFAPPFGAILLGRIVQPVWMQPPPLQVIAPRGNATPTPPAASGISGKPRHGVHDGVHRRPRWKKIGLEQLREEIEANEAAVAAAAEVDGLLGDILSPGGLSALDPGALAAQRALEVATLNLLADEEEAIIALLLASVV